MKHVQVYRYIIKLLALVTLAFLMISVSLPSTGVTAQESSSTPLPPKPGVPDGYTLIEGDILVRTELLTGKMPNAAFATNFWTNGIVPYEFDANVTQADQNAMLVAMADWENVANVDFRPRNGEGDYVHIQDSTENSSQVGRHGGGQIVNIFNWNWEFIMAHELGHTLGLWHEQSRPNRDDYVQINLQNVCQTCCNNGGTCNGNFNIHSEAGDYPRGGYDFDSVMHYDQCAFSTNAICPIRGGETIIMLPKYQRWQTLIGQRTHLSIVDQLTMSFLYPQANWRFVDNTYTGSGESGTFLKPYKTFAAGANATPSGGTLWVLEQGEYPAVGTYDKAMTIRAALGGVVLR